MSTCRHGPRLLDNLTHALVGAAVAKAGADRMTPLATPTLIVAANAPDLDVLAFASGPHFALAFRRGITHGWPAMLVLPFLVAAAFLWWDRRIRRRRDPSATPADPGALLLLAGVGVATHPALDWMNTYGMRWGLPFDDAWSYGDILFIVDPWLWLTLGSAVFLAGARTRRTAATWLPLAGLTSLLMLLAPVHAAAKILWVVGVTCALVVRSRPLSRNHLRRVNQAALALGALYILGSGLAFRAARGHVRTAAHDAGLAVVDILVAPLPASPFRSDVQVRTPEGYVPGVHRWLDRPRVALTPAALVPLASGPATLPAPHLRSILEEAAGLEDARHYLVWARYPYAVVTSAPEGWRVRFADVRYHDQGEAGGLGGVEVLVDRTAARPDTTGAPPGREVTP